MTRILHTIKINLFWEITLCSHLFISVRNDDDLYYNKKDTYDTNLQSHEIGFQTTIQFNLFSNFSLSCQSSINTRFTRETMMSVNKKPTFTVVLFSFQMLDAFLFHNRNFSV